MCLKSFLLSTAILAGLQGAAALGFDGNEKQVAAYWSNSSPTLAESCQDPNVDILILSFINHIDASGISAEFGGTPTGAEIKQCQQQGKTVLVSIGGESFYGNGWATPQEAKQAAQQVWDRYGGGKNGASAFGNVATNGFDLDFEQNINNLEAFAKKLYHLKKGAHNVYLTAAPQCKIPDANLGKIISNWHWFDALFVQFYNNGECGIPQAYQKRRFQSPAARRSALQSRNFNLGSWLSLAGEGSQSGQVNEGTQSNQGNVHQLAKVSVAANINGANVNGANASPTPTPSASRATPNPQATDLSGVFNNGKKSPKIFFGTPGSPQGVTRAKAGYASPELVRQHIAGYLHNPQFPNFGGVSVWNMYHAERNQQDPNFLQKVKNILKS